MKRVLLYFITLIVFIFFFTHHTNASDTIYEKIKKGYSTIEDIKGGFTQTSIIREMDRVMSFEGKFFIKIPEKMHWYYTGKESDEVYINRNEVIIYQPKHNQAFKSEYDHNSGSGLSPIVLLGGLKDIERVYNMAEKENYLRLIPIDSKEKINYIDIYPKEGDFPIEKIVITDKSDNAITIDLKKIEINSGLKDSIFRFQPPEETNIIVND